MSEGCAELAPPLTSHTGEREAVQPELTLVPGLHVSMGELALTLVYHAMLSRRAAPQVMKVEELA